jgi:hypothetical protein
MYKSRSILCRTFVTQPEWLPRMPARCERHVRRRQASSGPTGFPRAQIDEGGQAIVWTLCALGSNGTISRVAAVATITFEVGVSGYGLVRIGRRSLARPSEEV